MAAALFGLIGVFVGGIITAGSNYLLDRRRERAVSERDSRNHTVELRRAARLIHAELLRAAAAARLCVKHKRWSVPNAKLTTKAWQKYSGVIAPELSYDDWLAVVKAVLAIDDLGLDRLAGEISDACVQQIVPVLEDMDAGLRALSPFVRDVPPA